MRKTTILTAAALLLILLFLTGCTVTVRPRPGETPFPARPPRRSTSVIGPIRNNSTVSLDAVTYFGDLVIDANRVTVRGRGTGRTVISGSVFVDGNSAVITGLTVNGDVTINSNNNDLSGARIRGRVRNNGRNNRW